MAGIIACGSRDWEDAGYVYEVLDTLEDIVFLIEGEARGADSIAALWAKERGVNLIRMPAEWGQFGKGAGPIRNGEMGRLLRDMGDTTGETVYVVAFHPDIFESLGTRSMVKIAQQLKLEVRLFPGAR